MVGVSPKSTRMEVDQEEERSREEEGEIMSWRNHKYAGYRIVVKVYDQPSDAGIRRGRVSKLEIRTRAGKIVTHYDRGWSIKPSKDIHRTIVNWVLNKYKTKKKRGNK